MDAFSKKLLLFKRRLLLKKVHKIKMTNDAHTNYHKYNKVLNGHLKIN